MKKTDLLNLVRDELGLKSKKEAQEFLDGIDKVFEAIAERLEVGEGKVKVGSFFTLEKKHFEAKTGVAMGREYSIDAHDEVILKKTNALKNIIK